MYETARAAFLRVSGIIVAKSRRESSKTKAEEVKMLFWMKKRTSEDPSSSAESKVSATVPGCKKRAPAVFGRGK